MSIVSAHSVDQSTTKLAHSVDQIEEPEGYARLVVSVLHDSRLSHCDKLVFAELAYHVWQGTIAKVGQRSVAKVLDMSRTQVGKSLKRLLEFGHIEASGKVVKSVQSYHLTSKRFGQKQRAGIQEVAIGPSGGKRLVSVRSA